MHLIDKHMFPQDYDFFVVNDGIDRRSSMLRSGKHRRRSSAAKIEARSRQRSLTIEIGVAEKEIDEKGAVKGLEKKASPQAGNVKVVEMETTSSDEEKNDDEMEGLSGAMSALNFVPRSVRFGGRGRGRGRGGFSRN
jgi:hypothetical protein